MSPVATPIRFPPNVVPPALWTGVILIALAVLTLGGIQLLERFFTDDAEDDPLARL